MACNDPVVLISVSFSDCIVLKVGQHARTVLHVMQYTPPDRPCPLCTYQDHTTRVLAVGWSPDGRRITSASDDGTVQVLQAP